MEPEQKIPQWLMTHWCSRCLLETGNTDLESPNCMFCGRKGGLLELSREPFSREALARSMKSTTDRVIKMTLAKRGISIDRWPKNDEVELILLEALVQGEDLKTRIDRFGVKVNEA